MSFKKIEIKKNITISIVENIEIPKDLRVKLDKIWEEESRKNAKIFDGKVLFYLKVNNGKIECFYSYYRYWYSQRFMGEPDQSFRFLALAVTGVITSKNLVFLGKRSQNVTQDKGLFEVFPSGGISIDSGGDFKEQLLQEFEEEVGANRSKVSSILPAFILEDDENNVVDIVSTININCDINQLSCSNEEYNEFLLLDLGDVVLSDTSLNLSEISRIILGDISIWSNK